MATLSLAELTAWRDDVAARRDSAAALAAVEAARNPGVDLQERFLRSCNLGHLRSRVIELAALRDWLAQAVTAVAAGGTHPAQYTGAPTAARVDVHSADTSAVRVALIGARV